MIIPVHSFFLISIKHLQRLWFSSSNLILLPQRWKILRIYRMGFRPRALSRRIRSHQIKLAVTVLTPNSVAILLPLTKEGFCNLTHFPLTRCSSTTLVQWKSLCAILSFRRSRQVGEAGGSARRHRPSSPNGTIINRNAVSGR